MKKLQSIALEKILLFCGFSLALTLAGFWQFQHNVGEAEKIARVQNGVGTCFARVNQTFTAAMIRETGSPYLKRDFMTLSDECLREGTKNSGLEISTLPKASSMFNDLVSEVYWFHEKVTKVLTGSTNTTAAPLQAISEKYVKIESLKMDLQDQLELIAAQYREARLRDELLVAVAFLLFIASLAILGFKEARQLRHKRAMEKQALSLLNTGHAQVGAMVDQLVQKALSGIGMPVSSQVFTDYHSGLLEQMANRAHSDEVAPVVDVIAPQVIEEVKAQEVIAPKVEVSEIDARKILTAQAVRLKAAMEVQEGMIFADAEVLAQMLQAFGQRFSSGNVKLAGVREGDFYKVSVTAEQVCLTASELNYITDSNSSLEGVDVNVIIAMDLIRENGLNAVVKNRLSADGVLVGAEAVLTYPVNTNRTLVNIVRGKKKDLARAFSPSQFN